ncbi:MAG: betaine/proline/choline family ABC transporter ATP-binding protein [Coriobacteriia bacterium]|nr:betaine/proline/choline family ABC transporter ATP-binding protein [Coriobacteriia bacterium]MBN2821949.1 betaine/proline/choline family ABC transporter ATP-binding protein [Coriobacteriia bacterium]
MIRLEGVTRRYGDELAVDDLSLEVAEGEVCVLIGPSGCGKTTTLRMINRLIEPSGGSIMVNGRNVMSMRPEELRRGLGYVIQSIGLFPHLSVERNIGVVPHLLGWDKQRMAERARELLHLVGLDPEVYLGKYPRQLSGGEAQRVGVARALAADPPVLLMDEPFGAVDPLNRERLQAEFARIQRELHKTVLFVTHDIDEAIRLADKVAIMRDGRLQQFASPEEVLNHPANKFVHDFVGADRALKRLVRVRVEDVMRSPAIVQEGSEELAFRVAAGRRRFVYVIDAAGKLVGWMDTADLEPDMDPAEALTRVDPAQASVRSDASLRDALSRMLGLGFRAIAVTDDKCRLVGEVTFAAVEEAMTEGDEHITNIAEEDAG